jgi:hypothetical protein
MKILDKNHLPNMKIVLSKDNIIVALSPKLKLQETQMPIKRINRLKGFYVASPENVEGKN